jgi:tetratricopeptide (TPR) repeat protein
MLVALFAQAGAKEDIQADMVAGRWSQADERLDGVLKKHPDNALAHYWRAEVKFKLGQTELAQAEVRTARELDPSEKFASNKAMLARIMQAKPAAAEKPTELTESAGLQPAFPTQPEPAHEPASPAPKSQGKAGFGFLLLLGVLTLGVLAWWFIRSNARKELESEREHWTGLLNEASKDLADAILASDGNPQNSPELRLGNYDRAKKAQADLLEHQGSFASRKNFAQTQSLVARSHDIAAEIRGEERPSDRAERLELERRAAMQAAGYGQGVAPPAFGYNTPQQAPAGTNMLGTVAAVGAGLAIGNLLSSRAEASPRHSAQADRPDYIPFSSEPVDEVDVGGQNAGSDDWNSGSDSFDVGGGDSSSSFD